MSQGYQPISRPQAQPPGHDELVCATPSFLHCANWYREVRDRFSSTLVAPYVMPYTEDMRKTSVYLDDQQAERLAALAREAGRPQAEILREAISAYRLPSSHDRSFALAVGFQRIDDDARPISEIPEHELLYGFGA